MASSGGVSRVAKGADCKSAAVWLRRFESFFPHQFENAREIQIFAGVFIQPKNRGGSRRLENAVASPSHRKKSFEVRHPHNVE